MRTVIALLLLAVAANCYVIKTGGLKGSWATDIAVLGPDDDVLAPTISAFVIDDEAATLVVNASSPSDDTGYYTYSFTSSDASDSQTCSIVSQLWNDAGDEVIAELDIGGGYIYIPLYYPQGDYVTTVTCSDFTGNTDWWDSVNDATAVFGVTYSDHTVDETPYVTSNFEVNGQTGALSYSITDDGALEQYAITFDYETDAESDDPFDLTAVWGGEITGSWTALGGTTVQMTWAASCVVGTCTAYLYGTEDSEPGVYQVSGGTVWDSAGNEATISAAAISITLSENDHTQTVVSCQTLIMTDATEVPDVTSSYDTFGVTLGCTVKDDVVLAGGASATIIYRKIALVADGDDMITAGVMANNLDYTNDLSDTTGILATYVTIDFGSPEGPYALQEVTTRTEAGMTQTYTLDLGSASSAAPSVAALVVAAAAALLRL
jgi:hypothetical protein